jgi:hypothetical protein
MRSVNSRAALGAALAAALAGCGNYSTEDLRFLAALPTRADLHVDVPAQGSPSASALQACATRPADTWLWAKPTSDGLNAGVEFLLGLVDAVRRAPPTWRDRDARAWGPFDDAKHPGREIRVGLVRDFPDGADGPPRFSYGFDARLKGTAAWQTVIAGTFTGASATLGSGGLALDFDALWTLGMADPGAPHGLMLVQYDRASEPRTLALSLDQDGFGLARFGYDFAGYADRSGRFDYAFRNAGGDLFVVSASFDAAGRGRAQVAFTSALGASASFRQCWDAGACLTYVLDPGGYSCSAPPCDVGTDPASDCPEVPASPF